MMINPAPDVPDSLEEDSTNDLSKYSYNSDKPDANAAGMHSENNLDGEVPEDEDESFQRPNLSGKRARNFEKVQAKKLVKSNK